MFSRSKVKLFPPTLIETSQSSVLKILSCASPLTGVFAYVGYKNKTKQLIYQYTINP